MRPSASRRATKRCSRAREAAGSHRGYDRGALPLARAIARSVHGDAAFGQVSRLLVDLNRSLSHKDLLSGIRGGFRQASSKR